MINQHIAIHKYDSLVLAKIKSENGIPVSYLKGNPQLEQEGGVLFLGHIPTSEIDSAMILRIKDGSPFWTLYRNVDGKWKVKKVTDDYYYREFLNDALETSDHPYNQANMEALIQDGWPKPKNKQKATQ